DRTKRGAGSVDQAGKARHHHLFEGDVRLDVAERLHRVDEILHALARDVAVRSKIIDIAQIVITALNWCERRLHSLDKDVDGFIALRRAMNQATLLSRIATSVTNASWRLPA